MVMVPGAMPATAPAASTVPTLGALVCHVPPAGEELSVVIAPWHIRNEPVMFAGKDCTVTVVLAAQPMGNA